MKRYVVGGVFLLLSLPVAGQASEAVNCYQTGAILNARGDDFQLARALVSGDPEIVTLHVRLDDAFAKDGLAFTKGLAGRPYAIAVLNDLVVAEASSRHPSSLVDFHIAGQKLPYASDFAARLNIKADARQDVLIRFFEVKNRIQVKSNWIETMQFDSIVGNAKMTLKAGRQPDQLLSLVDQDNVDQDNKADKWRCFVAGREAEGWSVDKNQSPPVLHFKLK